DGIHGTELWKSDGTEAGTTMVKDINCGSDTGVYNADLQFINVNGTLFFVADDGLHGSELWKTDGTAAGTVMVADINPHTYFAGWEKYIGAPSDPYSLTNVNGTLFFTANDGTHHRKLWKTDGTAAGTVMVTDINPGDSDRVYGLTNVNGTLFFSAND